MSRGEIEYPWGCAACGRSIVLNFGFLLQTGSHLNRGPSPFSAVTLMNAAALRKESFVTKQNLALTAIAIVLAATSLSAQEPKKATKLPAYWQQDFATAQAEAKSTGKPLMAVFSTSWCSPCLELVKNVYPNPEVEAALKPYVCVYVDCDKQDSIAKKFNIEAYPSFVFLDSAGKELLRQTGVVTSVPGFLSFLKRASKRSAPVNAEPTKPTTDTPGESKAGQPEPLAVAALNTLATSGWRLIGKAQTKNEPDELGMGFVMMGGGPKSAKAFTGGFHFQRSEQGDLVFASASKLPAIAIYSGGSKVLTQTTGIIGQDVDKAQLHEDLRLLMRMDRLMKWAHTKSKWTVSSDEQAGSKCFTAKLPADLFQPNRSSDSEDELMPEDMGMLLNPMALKIINGTLALTTAEDGSLSGLSLTIVRNDPMATMQALMEEQGDEGEGLDIMALRDMEPIPGEVHVYEFSTSKGEAPDRIKALFSEFRALLK